jgi:hypothetical protein
MILSSSALTAKLRRRSRTLLRFRFFRFLGVEWCVDGVRARGRSRLCGRLGPTRHTHQLASELLHVAPPHEKGVSFQP